MLHSVKVRVDLVDLMSLGPFAGKPIGPRIGKAGNVRVAYAAVVK